MTACDSSQTAIAPPPHVEPGEPVRFGRSTLFHADCFDWLEQQQDNSLHAVVTDPPYGLPLTGSGTIESVGKIPANTTGCSSLKPWTP